MFFQQIYIPNFPRLSTNVPRIFYKFSPIYHNKYSTRFPIFYQSCYWIFHNFLIDFPRISPVCHKHSPKFKFPKCPPNFQPRHMASLAIFALLFFSIFPIFSGTIARPRFPQFRPRLTPEFSPICHKFFPKYFRNVSEYFQISSKFQHDPIGIGPIIFHPFSPHFRGRSPVSTPFRPRSSPDFPKLISAQCF